MERFTETERKMAHDSLMYCPSFAEETEGKMEQDPLMYNPCSATRATAIGIPVSDQGVAMLLGR
jgi:hypothetical protein